MAYGNADDVRGSARDPHLRKVYRKCFRRAVAMDVLRSPFAIAKRIGWFLLIIGLFMGFVFSEYCGSLAIPWNPAPDESRIAYILMIIKGNMSNLHYRWPLAFWASMAVVIVSAVMIVVGTVMSMIMDHSLVGRLVDKAYACGMTADEAVEFKMQFFAETRWLPLLWRHSTRSAYSALDCRDLRDYLSPDTFRF